MQLHVEQHRVSPRVHHCRLLRINHIVLGTIILVTRLIAGFAGELPVGRPTVRAGDAPEDGLKRTKTI